MSSKAVKAIIKNLADAPSLAVSATLKQLENNPNERAEAIRIFNAVGLCKNGKIDKIKEN